VSARATENETYSERDVAGAGKKDDEESDVKRERKKDNKESDVKSWRKKDNRGRVEWERGGRD
jgi:hypothetical protein